MASIPTEPRPGAPRLLPDLGALREGSAAPRRQQGLLTTPRPGSGHGADGISPSAALPRRSSRPGPARPEHRRSQRCPAPPQPSGAREAPRRTAPAPPAEPRAASRLPGPAASILSPGQGAETGDSPSRPHPVPRLPPARGKGTYTRAPLRARVTPPRRHGDGVASRPAGRPLPRRGAGVVPALPDGGVGGKAGPPRGGCGLRRLAPGRGVVFGCPCAAPLLPVLCSGLLCSP